MGFRVKNSPAPGAARRARPAGCSPGTDNGTGPILTNNLALKVRSISGNSAATTVQKTNTRNLGWMPSVASLNPNFHRLRLHHGGALLVWLEKLFPNSRVSTAAL